MFLLATKFAFVAARGPVPIEADALGYWQLSSLALSGDWLLIGEPIAYRTPVYPYFLATIRAVTGPWAVAWIVAIQSVLAIAALWIAGRIAVKISQHEAALPLTLVAALPSVSAATYCSVLLSETLFIALMMWNLLAVVHLVGDQSPKNAALVGLTFALTLLTRPIIILLWIAHIALFAMQRYSRNHDSPNDRQRRGDRGTTRVLGSFAIAVVTVLVLCSPWLARNIRLFGTAKLTEFMGRNMWVATFQEGAGTGLDLPTSVAGKELQDRLGPNWEAIDWRQTWVVSDALVASGLNDVQSDRLMKRVAVDAIATAPVLFAEKAFRRIVNYWRCATVPLPAQGIDGHDQGQRIWHARVPLVEWIIDHRISRSVAANTVLAIIITMATLVLIADPLTRTYGVWILLIFAYFCAVTGVLEIPTYRYRIVIEPLAALTIGSAIATVWRWKSGLHSVDGATSVGLPEGLA